MEDKHFENHFDSGLHNWEKKGKVKSKSLRGENYTAYECANCGLKAKMHKINKKEKKLTFIANFNRRDVQACKHPIPFKAPKRIEIISLDGQGTGAVQYKYAKPGTQHDVIKKPPGWFLNDHRSVWIQGHGTPIKIFTHEFKEVPKFSRKKKKKKKKKHVVFHRG